MTPNPDAPVFVCRCGSKDCGPVDGSRRIGMYDRRERGEPDRREGQAPTIYARRNYVRRRAT